MMCDYLGLVDAAKDKVRTTVDINPAKNSSTTEVGDWVAANL